MQLGIFFLHKFFLEIQGFGNITSTPIVSLPEYKTMVNLNNDHQDLQNNVRV